MVLLLQLRAVNPSVLLSHLCYFPQLLSLFKRYAITPQDICTLPPVLFNCICTPLTIFSPLYSSCIIILFSLSLHRYSISSWTAVSQGESGQTNWTSVSRWDLISLRSHRCPLRCPCFTQMWLNSLKQTHGPVRTQPIPLTPSAEPQHHLWRTQSSIQSDVLMTHHQSHDAFVLGKRWLIKCRKVSALFHLSLSKNLWWFGIQLCWNCCYSH